MNLCRSNLASQNSVNGSNDVMLVVAEGVVLLVSLA